MPQNVIYEPKGRAGEYAPLACNLYRGCTHGCIYCYVPRVIKMTKSDFHSSARSRGNILHAIKRDSIKYANDPRNVLMCFTTDPYPAGITLAVDITREAIQIMNQNGLKVTILSKGGLRSTRDFDVLSDFPGNEYATTLTYPSSKPRESLRWEKFAALPSDRVEALKRAHDHGIRTWVSLEPVLHPDSPKQILEETHEFVDFYKLGKLNHMLSDDPIDWRYLRDDMISRFESYGFIRNSSSRGYMIKRDLEMS